jgi:hypothetical protein
MRAFKFRRLTVAAALALLASLGGVQAVASGAQPRKSPPGSQSHNPTCKSAFGHRVCVAASPTGLTFRFTGYTYFSGEQGPAQLGNCGKGCGAEAVVIQGPSSDVLIIKAVTWVGSSTHSVFIRLKKPDDYTGDVVLNNPRPSSIAPAGAYLYYRLIVPQVGNSNLMIKQFTLPAGKVGARYFCRFSASGGDPPYNWTLVSLNPLPKGLGFSGTGPEAGTIHGIPRRAGYVSVGVMVHDKVGHAAFAQAANTAHIAS